MTSERLLNSFIFPKKLLYPQNKFLATPLISRYRVINVHCMLYDIIYAYLAVMVSYQNLTPSIDGHLAYSHNSHVRFHPDPIWNDEALGFLKTVIPRRRSKRRHSGSKRGRGRETDIGRGSRREKGRGNSKRNRYRKEQERKQEQEQDQ